jgi:nucleotide-binding universal stress UspA family protein
LLVAATEAAISPDNGTDWGGFAEAAKAVVIPESVYHPREALMIQNIKKILTPIDFSTHSMEAMRGAMELAKDLGAEEVHLVHVIAPQQRLIPSTIEQNRELAREGAMLEQAEEELARIKKDELGNSKKVITCAVVGPPVEKLVNYAKEQLIDLIVVATHGRTGGEHILIGSVSEKLVRNSPCSVLVFRPRAR